MRRREYITAFFFNILIIFNCVHDGDEFRVIKKDFNLIDNNLPLRRDVYKFPLISFRNFEEHNTDTLPLAITPRFHPKIGNGAIGSISVGTYLNGFLVNHREIPLQGRYHKVMDVQAKRGTNFGTEEIIGAILRAAQNVARRYEGSILYVGNISKGGGGDIKWSASHNSGRDADIGFYLIDREGKQVEMRDMVKLDRDGWSIDPPFEYRFDLRRNWELVKSFLNDKEIQVQWIFVYYPLKRKLIEYAKRIKEPSSIILRAEEVLHQPGDSFPHNDHFHLRIYCSKDDLLDGCEDGKIKRSYKRDFSYLVKERKRELFKFLKQNSPQVRRDAVYLLSLLHGWEYINFVAKLLNDKSPEVRLSSIKFIDDSGEANRYGRNLVSLLKKEENPLIIKEIIQLITKLEPSKKIKLLQPFLYDHRKIVIIENFYREEWRVSERVAEIFGKSRLKESVFPLVSAIEKTKSEDGIKVIHNSLKFLTNQDVLNGKEISPSTAISSLWKEWLKKNQKYSRKKWILDGFKTAGFEISKFDKDSVVELLEALKTEEDYLAYNASIMLSIITRKKYNYNHILPHYNYNFWASWIAKR